MPDRDGAPSPSWFVRYRAQILAVWVALGMAGSTSVWVARYIEGRNTVYGLLSAGGALATVMLVAGAWTRYCWLIRKGAGLAVLLHIGRAVSLVWAIHMDHLNLPWGWPWRAGTTIGDWPFFYTSVGTVLVVVSLALQAGWLYWVAGLGQSCRGRP